MNNLGLTIVIGTMAIGILTLVLRNCDFIFWTKNKSKASLLVNVIGVFLFIMSQQPYAAIFVFVFFIIKVLILTKK